MLELLAEAVADSNRYIIQGFDRGMAWVWISSMKGELKIFRAERDTGVRTACKARGWEALRGDGSTLDVDGDANFGWNSGEVGRGIRPGVGKERGEQQ